MSGAVWGPVYHVCGETQARSRASVGPARELSRTGDVARTFVRLAERCRLANQVVIRNIEYVRADGTAPLRLFSKIWSFSRQTTVSLGFIPFISALDTGGKAKHGGTGIGGNQRWFTREEARQSEIVKNGLGQGGFTWDSGTGAVVRLARDRDARTRHAPELPRGNVALKSKNHRAHASDHRSADMWPGARHQFDNAAGRLGGTTGGNAKWSGHSGGTPNEPNASDE
ncbi:hypothetical protein CONPUDRAFT_75551 [Coniophora puteana RWD-64-598 SS2]|uniref:Uncharacterized protein n=1 Tax=Coniophora puteana (strain RWD-64-598) TaxID=741705 RepID=A0A5M3MGL6_CONPW|nr:uncharacterized protein CONPUDRAFT_75551 [Coniophora puteana RWD-64-598 SS2]EIW77751.1 hypothetical protein CONPUDRAFT_75551 [Coniophora puteana RWD-64-598 SS2]